MGNAALTVRGGEYAIHMHNSDIRELFRLVSVGTPVVVEQ
jgi:hypothetical protein